VESARVALIGFGHGGELFHAPFLASTPGLRLAAIVTTDKGRRARASRNYPDATLLGSPEEVWAERDELELVVVSTPNSSHVELARAALDAGLAVVVDKPLAPSAAEARMLVELAAARGLLLTVFQNRRWDGDFLTVRGLLDSGELGRVIRFESRYERWRP
jgi:predicted dehydrogenase